MSVSLFHMLICHINIWNSATDARVIDILWHISTLISDTDVGVLIIQIDCKWLQPIANGLKVLQGTMCRNIVVKISQSAKIPPMIWLMGEISLTTVEILNILLCDAYITKIPSCRLRTAEWRRSLTIWLFFCYFKHFPIYRKSDIWITS